MITDWTDAYSNMIHIPEGASFPARWNAEAAGFRDRSGARNRLDIPYGPGARQRMDLFRPEGAPRGLAILVHGGFWMAFDKSVWSHWARGAVAAGWAVIMPTYTLAPEIRVGGVTQEIKQAIMAASALVSGPIRLAGHSAGGHLVTRMICADTGLPAELVGRIESVLTISGLHDLRPLMLTAMNKTLQLDLDEARRESPALCEPLTGIPVTCWVGGDERPEFIRQSRLLANIWTGRGLAMTDVIEPGRHHFDICAGLTEPDSPITRAWLD